MYHLILMLPQSTPSRPEGFVSVDDTGGVFREDEHLFGSGLLRDDRIGTLVHPYARFVRDCMALGSLTAGECLGADPVSLRFPGGEILSVNGTTLIRLLIRYSNYKGHATELRRGKPALWLSCHLIPDNDGRVAVISSRNCEEALSAGVEKTVRAWSGAHRVTLSKAERPRLDCGAPAGEPSVGLEFGRGLILGSDGRPDRERVEAFRRMMAELYTQIAESLG